MMKPDLNSKRVQMIFIGLVTFVSLVYAFTTNHIWEDFYITFRHSKNLVDGNGLVYQAGERIHGFTSVINTLLPAFFYWSTNESFQAMIWLYRITSIIGLVFGGVFFLREIQKQNTNNIITPIFFTLLFAFQAKTVMFTVNGQEAGFILLFLLPSIVFAFNGYREKWKWAGICWAGLIYTRPDGVVYILLLSIASFTFGNSKFKSKDDLLAIIKVAALCAVLYLPWFIFAWVYYGTPIPHTVTAKSGLGGIFLADIVKSLQAIISYQPAVGVLALEPTYYHFGGWPYWIKVYAFIGWFVSSIYWLIPSTDRFGRFVSFIYTLLILYLSFLQFRAAVYPWYFPPAEIMSIFVLSSALFHLTRKIFKSSLIPAYAIGMILLFSATKIYFMTLNQITIQQKIIETGNRKQIGLWLNKNIEDNDTVFLEPLGYIGYYSNAKMYDWPGLVSPEVVAIAKGKGVEAYPQIIKTLKPNWVILRPVNITQLLKILWFKQNYKIVKIFSVKERLKQYKNVAGMDYLLFDSEFVIFKRNSDTIN